MDKVLQAETRVARGGAAGGGGGGGGNGNGAGTSAISIGSTDLLLGGGGGGGALGYTTSNNGALTFGGGGGGAGGYGAIVTGGGLQNTNSGTISGGGGGGGPGSKAGAGNGGDGGVGIIFTNGGETFTNSGTVAAGGGGGASFSFSDDILTAGPGGNGGVGVIFAGGGATLINNGVIQGGNGGGGGGSGVGSTAVGGFGGNGIVMSGGGTIENRGTIQGGAGGFSGSNNGSANRTIGGYAIIGAGLTVTNSGTIAAGPGRLPSIQFTGGVNALELRAGSVITGAVWAFSAADTLRLGGNVDSSFDVSTIGRQYRDFGIYEKTGTGTWTLNGSTSEVTSWTIGQGTLSVWLDAHLGAASGALTFDGGVLRVMSTMFTATSRTINWGPGGGGFDIADSANNFTVSQALTGQGGLTKLGAGTLTLTGINTYSGGTVVNGGTLRIGGDWALGDVSGALTLNGGALQVTGSPLNFTLERQVILGANGGTFDVGAGKNLILDGVVSGDGQLAKTSSGTLTLNSANSYSGGTAVRGGGLVVAATGALGDGPVTINSNGSGGWAKLYFSGNDAANPVSAQDLSITVGSGDLNFQRNATAGAATIVLAKDGYGGLNFSTGTDAGTASITNQGGGFVAFTGASAANATIVNDGLGIPYYFSRTTFDGDYSSNVSSSAGEATITNRNGGSTVFYGHSDGGTATLVNEAGGTLDFQGSSQAQDATVVNGAGGSVLVRFRDQDSVLDVGSLSGDGAIQIDDSQLSLGALGHDDVIGGVISGNGSLTKTGTGKLTLNGQNSYAGPTTVGTGTLVVGDASHGDASLAGDVTVDSGARLGGIGTIGGNVTILGTHGVGNSIGVQTVGGNYVNHGIFEVEATPSGADKLIVGGTVDISGATLNLVLTPATAESWNLRNGPYTIIQNNGAADVAGTFASVGNLNDLLFLDHLINYKGGDGNDITLTLARNDVAVANVATTGNQIATAGALDRLGEGSALAWAMLLMTDKDAARLALDAASGEVHASAKGMLIEDSRFVADAATARVRAAMGDVTAPAMPVMAYGEGGPELVEADTSRFVVWGQAFGSWGTASGDGNAAGLDRSTGGFLAGGDTAIGEAWRVGLLTGYSHASFDVDDRASSGSSDTYHIGLYGGGQWDGLGLRGGVAYSWNRIDTSRNVVVPGFADALTAKYDAGTAQVFGEAGYRVETRMAAFEPFASLAYINLHTDGFAEKGGAAALTSAASTTETTFTTLGLRATAGFDLGGVQATAQGTLGWRHAFGDTTPTTDMAFAGGDLFTIAGVPIAKDTAIVGAGLDFRIADRTTLGISYSGQFGTKAADQGVRATMEVRF
ncbi:autotransporter domain-containing protein [Mesorhizobium sp. M0848]|uniref:autotransporter domain-containing protein n=1 Tax=Mesorhizobium sp. M0848 TaxID=2957012 RepID=UPI0033384CDD